MGPTKIPTPTVRQGRTFSIGRRSFLRSSLLLHARTIVFSRGPGLIFPETSGAVKKMRGRRRVCVGKPTGNCLVSNRELGRQVWRRKKKGIQYFKNNFQCLRNIRKMFLDRPVDWPLAWSSYLLFLLFFFVFSFFLLCLLSCFLLASSPTPFRTLPFLNPQNSFTRVNNISAHQSSLLHYTHFTKMVALHLSEESRERLGKVMGTTRDIVHYSWIPFILYLGWASTSTKPNFVQLLSPFPSA